MDDKIVALILQSEADNIRTALRHVKELLPPELNAKILDPVYEVLNDIENHIDILLE